MRWDSHAGAGDSRHMHGRPLAPVHHRYSRWVADARNVNASARESLRHAVADAGDPSAREHLWHAAVRSMCTNASSAFVRPTMSLRSSHLISGHLFYFKETAVDSA